MIFKILTRPQWETLQAVGEFLGSADDLRDGFIHLSNGPQVQATLDKHYKYDKIGGADLVLAAIDTDALDTDALKYEVSRGGAKFPHLYAPLPRGAVAQHWVLQSGEKGRYDAPKLMTDDVTDIT